MTNQYHTPTMARRSFLLGTGGALLVNGCPAVVAAIAQREPVIPAWADAHAVEIKRNLVYATVGSVKLDLDVYMPKHGSGPFPAVIYIHGGGWIGGNKLAFARQAIYMASKGFVGASINYRLLPTGYYPHSIFDAKAAVRWLRANAAKYRVDPNRIGAAGGSAGGQLVGLLGTTTGLRDMEGDEGVTGVSSHVSAVAAFNPALNLPDMWKYSPMPLVKVLISYMRVNYPKNPELWREASPAFHVNKAAVPFLFLHGDADNTIPYHESVDMMKALKRAGVLAELYTAHGAMHGFFNTPRWVEPTTKRMEEFFETVFVRS